MYCPIDVETALVMTERQGIEIDYCPKCRGVWLDRGELDKILERSASGTSPQTTRYQDERPRQEERPRYDDEHRREGEYRGKRKRDSFLDDLFDFG
jgi:uncharacterized protein